MAVIDPKAQRALIQHWLPRLQQIERDRRPIVRLMVFLLLGPLIFALLLSCYQILYLEKIDAFISTFSTVLVGWSVLAFVYLGRIQECNDVIKLIEAVVYLGDKNALLKALPRLSCLGGFKSIIDHAKQLI